MPVFFFNRYIGLHSQAFYIDITVHARGLIQVEISDISESYLDYTARNN